jgi:hypothetical protein
MERWTAGRMRSRLRRLTVTLSCVVAGALVTGHVAWQEHRAADMARTRAAAREAAALAGRARATDPRTGTLLRVAAWRLAPTAESRAALLTALAEPELDVFTGPVQGGEGRDFLTDSGRTLLTVGGGRWSAWDVDTHRRTGSGPLPDVPVTAVSPDGGRWPSPVTAPVTATRSCGICL